MIIVVANDIVSDNRPPGVSSKILIGTRFSGSISLSAILIAIIERWISKTLSSIS